MNERPKLMVLTTSFPRFYEDEATLFLGRLIEALSSEGYSGWVVVPQDRDELQQDSRAHFHIERFRYGIFSRGALAFGNGILPNLRKKPLLILQAPALLFQMFRTALRYRREFDLIHGHWAVSAFPAYFLSCISGKPFLLTIRGEDIKLLRTPLRHLFAFFLKRAAHISTVSDEFVREVSEILPSLRDKLSCTPNGITRFHPSEEERSILRGALGIDTTSMIGTYVGRVVPLKQPKLLIQAVQELRNEFPGFILVLAGRVATEYKQELLEYAEELGISERVRIPGPMTPKQVGTLLSISRVYLSASTHEGRSNAVLEALASGVPVCGSDIAGHQELITHDYNGKLFNVHSHLDAAAKLQELLTDDEKWKILSQQAELSVQSLTWEASARCYGELFSKLLDS